MVEDWQEKPSRSYGPRYWRFGIIGCSVLIVFLLAVLVFALFLFSRSPYYRGIINCRSNIKRVGAALERYSIKNGEYPGNLSKLVPEYLPDASALNCPAAGASGAPAYDYSRQDIDAPDTAILLTCDRHRLRASKRPTVIHFLKDGHVVLVSPSGDVRTGR